MNREKHLLPIDSTEGTKVYFLCAMQKKWIERKVYLLV